MKYQLSASIICANFLTLKEQIRLLEKGEIDYIHFDVMDGIFVPRYGLPAEILKDIHSISSIPITVHMMVQDPEDYVKVFTDAGAKTLVFHLEPVYHIHRTIKLIKDHGVKVGVALNPATSLTNLEYILEDIDLVMLMAINPGIVGDKLIESVLGKIAKLKSKLSEYPHIKIEIDGGVTFESAPEMVKRGADILVCGNSTIFRKGEKIDKKIQHLRRTIDKQVIP